MKKLLMTITILSAFMFQIQAANAAGDMGEFHYKSGEKYASQSKFEKALNEYGQAIGKDGENFSYWLGKGQAELGLSKHAELKNTLEKLEDIEDSREQKLEWLILSAQAEFAAKDDRWLTKTKDLFFNARTVAGKLKVDRPDLLLLMGRVYKDVGKYREARKHYSEVIVLGGPEAALANNELASIFRKQQAQGSGKGWIGDLAARETIDKATLAYLLVDDLDVEKVFLPRSSKPQMPSDIEGHEYISAIEAILNLQMTTLGLDVKGNFNPEAPVTRYELAKLVEEVLVAKANKPELLRTFIGTKSPFPDVPSNFHAYNAVFLAVSRGLMTPDNLLEGSFAGDKTVSGEDVLLMLRKLGNL